MNAERLHAVVLSLYVELSKDDIPNKLDALTTALQNVVNNPHPNNQQILATARQALEKALASSSSDSFSPTWREVLKEIGVESFLGNALVKTLEEIFARNQITPAVALEELKRLRDNVISFFAALNNIKMALDQFHIGHEVIQPGECEVGILIPRKAVENRLPMLVDELDELTFIFNTISEVATGKQDNLTIKSMSSSEFLMFLQAALPYAACLTVAVERIVALYKQLLEIRKLRNELRSQGVPDASANGIDEHANSVMQKGIEQLAGDIIKQFYHQKDDGRKNELRNALLIALTKLATRIDKGFNIEVRVQPNPQQQNPEIQKSIELIQKASASMKFLKLTGDPILKLPEPKPRRKVKDTPGAS